MKLGRQLGSCGTQQRSILRPCIQPCPSAHPLPFLHSRAMVQCSQDPCFCPARPSHTGLAASRYIVSPGHRACQARNAEVWCLWGAGWICGSQSPMFIKKVAMLGQSSLNASLSTPDSEWQSSIRTQTAAACQLDPTVGQYSCVAAQETHLIPAVLHQLHQGHKALVHRLKDHGSVPFACP